MNMCLTVHVTQLSCLKWVLRLQLTGREEEVSVML